MSGRPLAQVLMWMIVRSRLTAPGIAVRVLKVARAAKGCESEKCVLTPEGHVLQIEALFDSLGIQEEKRMALIVSGADVTANGYWGMEYGYMSTCRLCPAASTRSLRTLQPLALRIPASLRRID
jgi:hypothetical protein